MCACVILCPPSCPPALLTAVPNWSFSTSMPRLTKAKPLEPYHRETYGSELNSGPFSTFHPRPGLDRPV